MYVGVRVYACACITMSVYICVYVIIMPIHYTNLYLFSHAHEAKCAFYPSLFMYTCTLKP